MMYSMLARKEDEGILPSKAVPVMTDNKFPQFTVGCEKAICTLLGLVLPLKNEPNGTVLKGEISKIGLK